MSKNFIQDGDILDLTAPSGGVVGGSTYKIGSIIAVALASVAEGLPFAGATEGCYTLAKATGAAWAQGDLLYWDDSGKAFTKTSSGNTKAGVAIAAAASGDTTGKVKLIASI